MAKRKLLVLPTIISMLMLAYPTAHAGSMQSSMQSMPREAERCQDKRTDEHCKACAASKEQCQKGARDCQAKFTVKEVVDQTNITVTYPESVWSVTVASEKDTTAEKIYREDYEKKAPYPIRLTATSAAPTAGNTYLFTRCPDNAFTLGAEIDPNDPTFENAPDIKQSKP